MIVAAIALLIFCASILLKAWTAEQLRQTGDKHDKLQMSYFNPARETVVQRPTQLDQEEPILAAAIRTPHPWRSR